MNLKKTFVCLTLLLSLTAFCQPQADSSQAQTSWWPAEVEQALTRAKANNAEIVKALNGAPAEQRKGMAFIVANMPDPDLRSLKADFLLENLALAYKARKEFAWCQTMPEAIFLNNVLPYANVDETRHPWRKEFYDMCAPVVKDCKTASEAAWKLNETVFEKVKVKYSTARKKANQSPNESIEQGLASCTGLSIILIDACRSVGVATRLVGTAMWTDKSGNHNWVEIWDNGDWHFTGACEPDPKGLDRGWFTDKASKAIKDSPQHAIFAVSFAKTDVSFPMVWSKQRKDISGENVTERYTQPQKKEPQKKLELSKEQLQEIEKQAKAYFAASEGDRAKMKFDAKLDQLLVGNDADVRRAVWKAYVSAPIHDAMKKDFTANQVRYKEHVSPYVVRKVGDRPKNGWPLVIAMHGGGNAPQATNDSQWKQMQKYYKDHPEVAGGYQYLALRAPNNTWNGFYDEYVPPLIMSLIRQFAVLSDVDTSKVFIMGYSHGGYGAYYIGPKIPDRFAAVHCSAGAATDNTISPLTLRNTRFTYMVGEKDTAYGRRERNEQFSQVMDKIKKDNPGEFPVEFEFKLGYQHSGLPDRDKLKEMLPFTRNAAPRHLTWVLGDAVLTDFYWVSVGKPGKKQAVDVILRDNKAQITSCNVKDFALGVDSRLVDFGKPLQVTLDGKASQVSMAPSFATLCQTMVKRGDAELACTCLVQLDGMNRPVDSEQFRLFEFKQKK
ncbi:MAG TPA: transglutaminase domain-containing protein [Gemmataceae bacterium]|nr:transglutaminase domain-containing protein [Gemmataceae bacterium]